MLFKLSLSNIKKSLRDYAVYFFTILIGVSVFYIFNSLDSQTAFITAASDSRSIIELMITIMNILSVFVAVVLGLLLVYANRFLMKRRSKEFAVYMMLGMSKGQITSILVVETIIIGMTSLITGLICGIGLSQLTSALVGNMFEADMSKYSFTVSTSAIIKTIIYFGIMYLIVMIFNALTLGKTKLINLLQFGKRSEKTKMKNPVLCIIVFIIGVCGLAYAYHSIDRIFEHKLNFLAVLIAIGSICTFLIFWSVSGMLLRLIMSMKKTYFAGLNSFTFRQLSSKINTMVMSMTVICLMLFVTICMISSAFSIRNSMNSTLNTNCPADIQIACDIDAKEENAYHLIDYCESKGFDISKYTKELCILTTYHDINFKTATFAANEDDSSMLKSLSDNPEELVPLSKYNELMRLYGKKEETPEKDQFILCCDYSQIKASRDHILSQNKKIDLFGSELTSKYDMCNPEGFIILSSQHINFGFFVVPDELIEKNIDKAYISSEYITGKYGTKNKNECKKIHEKLRDDYNKNIYPYNDDFFVMYNSKIDIANSTVGLAVLVTFIGLYVGLVFLIACGAVLSLKELSESADSITRYDMLRKIGVEEKDISRSLFAQTGLFFALPMVLAVIHSIFGMRFSKMILQSMGADTMLSSAWMTSCILLAIYGGYFIITYLCSKNIIRSNK